MAEFGPKFPTPERKAPPKQEGKEEQIEFAPEGWRNTISLAEEFNVRYYTVNDIAQKYEATNPDWFKKLKSPQKYAKVSTHYSPELVKIIEEQLAAKGEPAPQGWQTATSLAKEFHTGRPYIIKVAKVDEYRQTHPEWFKDYKTPKGSVFEHYSPDLIKIINERLAEQPELPDGWMTNASIAKKWGTGENTTSAIADTYRDSHPESFKMFKVKNGTFEHYSPELVKHIEEVLTSRGEPAPDGWKTRHALTVELGKQDSTIQRIGNKYRSEHPEWYRNFIVPSGMVFEHYAPELVQLLKEEANRYDDAPPGWITTGALAKKFRVDRSTIEKKIEPFELSNPEWIERYLDRMKKPALHISPELVSELEKLFEKYENPPIGWRNNFSLHVELNQTEQAVKKQAALLSNGHPDHIQIFKAPNGITEYYSPDLVEKIKNHFGNFQKVPEGWLKIKEIVGLLGVTRPTVSAAFKNYSQAHPEWRQRFKNSNDKLSPRYSPEFVKQLKQDLGNYERAPEGWMTNTKAAQQLFGLERPAASQEQKTTSNIAESYRDKNSEWFKEYRTNQGVFEHYAPELIQKIAEQVQINVRRRETRLPSPEPLTSEEGERVKSLMNIFGESSSVDILYATYPRFKALPVEEVQSMLADYLGNFLLVPGRFNPEELAKNLALLEIPTLREGLKEVIKENCLSKVRDEKKSFPEKTYRAIFAEYFEYIREKIGIEAPDERLEGIFQEIEAYYKAAFDREMPSHVVENLTEGREFPDIYQRINIQEIQDKQRLLIADEMGVGKSASAILAKESLGLKTALVVVPSNVLSTWEGYLSDKSEGDKKIGYFKEGQAPRVLMVQKPEDLKNLNAEEYDYILISQERLSNYYTELKNIPYDMLIVDEIHKLKNVREGVRSQHLLDLVASAQERQPYMALLSGTPVPNKIEDIAMLLKLLHPDQFADMENSKLISTIIRGNLPQLHALLVPYMQMKELDQHIEMPKLDQEIREYDLTPFEKDAYEALLEEDEMTPMQKMQVLRQFLLNPRILEIAPESPASKISELQQTLDSAFATDNKIIVFVNGYTDGVIKGEHILDELEVPPDFSVETVYGEISPHERQRIQTELQNGVGRMLLFVSGQTADVGVDYSAADHVIFYNEPWTEADRRQQLARAFRPGRTGPLKATTLIARGTIEVGMHEYIKIKYQAVEKLLKGIPITELEQHMLEQDEPVAKPDLEVNPELARYYFSSVDRLNRMFASVKELGEEGFKQFLDRYGEEYAESYHDLGTRSYQSNAGRVSGTLIHEMARMAHIEEPKILDAASGPQMLKRHSLPELAKDVVSLDLNPSHFTNGDRQGAVVGSFAKMPFADNTFDYVNFALALHYTRFIPSKNVYERAEALQDIHRVLKLGGRAIISLPHSVDLNMDSFRIVASALGFDIVEEFSGIAQEGSHYHSRTITLQKRNEEIGHIKEILSSLSREERNGLKLARNKIRLRDTRRVIPDFSLGGKTYEIALNEEDKQVLAEEQAVTQEMEDLKVRFGSIEDVTPEELTLRQMVRMRAGKKYLLFKKISQGGVVIGK